jgi:hypothetical protein
MPAQIHIHTAARPEEYPVMKKYANIGAKMRRSDVIVVARFMEAAPIPQKYLWMDSQN